MWVFASNLFSVSVGFSLNPKPMSGQCYPYIETGQLTCNIDQLASLHMCVTTAWFMLNIKI